MKTKTCKHCKEEIAKSAKICPKCGGRLGIPTFIKVIIVVVVIFGCIIGFVRSCTNSFNDTIEDFNDSVEDFNDSIEETKSSYADKNGKTSFKLNESFENKYEKITMTEVNMNFKDYNEYLAPAEGNKVILVKFEVENIGENDELYVSSLSFNGYVDGTAVNQYLYTVDNYNDLSATLSQGKKSIGYIAYEVPSNTEKITIEYNADFWEDGTIIEFVAE